MEKIKRFKHSVQNFTCFLHLQKFGEYFKKLKLRMYNKIPLHSHVPVVMIHWDGFAVNIMVAVSNHLLR